MGETGTLWEWGTGLARTQAIGIELGGIGRGFQPFLGLRNEQGECPPTPLIGSSCMCVDASSNLAVVATASGSVYVLGQHPDVHGRRYPPSQQSTQLGNGAAVAEPHQPPWTFQLVSSVSLGKMQPTETQLPVWCPPRQWGGSRTDPARGGRCEQSCYCHQQWRVAPALSTSRPCGGSPLTGLW